MRSPAACTLHTAAPMPHPAGRATACTLQLSSTRSPKLTGFTLPTHAATSAAEDCWSGAEAAISKLCSRAEACRATLSSSSCSPRRSAAVVATTWPRKPAAWVSEGSINIAEADDTSTVSMVPRASPLTGRSCGSPRSRRTW